MSLNLEKDKKSNLDWNFIIFCFMLGIVGITAIITINNTRPNKIENNSTNLKIQKCNKVSENIMNCEFLIISKE